ncbi:MAG: hypothetical protein HOP27_01540 [Anaerolineales bacterium]|nr:hypothetical protein [Anaerolineales bacterium]
MNLKHKKIFTLLALLLSLIPFQTALADMGPKPSMDFNFTQTFPGDRVSITGGILFECQQADCSDAKPLEEMGPQRFICEVITCHANFYVEAPYHRIEIQFSDGKTRQSNVFETAGFSSIYNVTIQQDDLLVKAKLNPTGIFSPYINLIFLCTACIIFPIVTAIIIAFFYILRLKKRNETEQ